jgi:hypothetical protein
MTLFLLSPLFLCFAKYVNLIKKGENFMRKSIQYIVVICLAISYSLQAKVETYTLDGEKFDQFGESIVIKNGEYDADGTTWTWKYYPESESTPPHRDLGQSFTTHESFWLDKIYVEIDNELMNPQEAFDACENAPFHLDILEFANVGDIEPLDTLNTQAGNLPAELDSTKIAESLFTLLIFDIEDYKLEAEKVYGFYLRFDSLRSQQHINLNKTHAGDYFPEGALYYVAFDGSEGRDKVETWSASHPGANPNRDLNFWLEKSSGTPVKLNDNPLPHKILLLQNYPNPFNPSTMLVYELYRDCTPELTIFNLSGQKVRTLELNGKTGHHSVEWDGKNDSGHDVPSGIYFYQLKADGFADIKKMTLIR